MTPPDNPSSVAPSATLGTPEIAPLRAELRRAQSTLARVDAGLAQLQRADPTPSPRARPSRYYELLLDVYEHGRHGIANEAFGAVGAAHGYDRRGLGGFFAGRRAPLRLSDDRVRLTPEGERLLEQHLQQHTS